MKNVLVFVAFILPMVGFCQEEKDPGYIKKTYLELYEIWLSHNLEKGQKYLITDYCTIYDQPLSNVPKISKAEPIIITATSDSCFSPVVNSLNYPEDIIHYDISLNKTHLYGVPAKGKITYRQDRMGNKAYFDFRHVLMFDPTDKSDSLFFNFDKQVSDNQIATTPELSLALGQIEFPASRIRGNSNNNQNNVFLKAFIKGDFEQNTNNRYFNSTFNSSIMQCVNNIISDSKFLGDVIQMMNLDITNCVINGESNYCTTGSWHSSVFEGQVNKVMETNFYRTTVKGPIDRLINSGFLNDTFMNRLFWCSSLFVSNSYFENEFSGVNTLSIVSTHVNCHFKNVQGLTQVGGFVGFENCNILGNQPWHRFEKVVVQCLVKNKTIDENTYPELFNTSYTKTILMGSNGKIYFKYFNGETDIYKEII